MMRRYTGKWHRFAQPDPYNGSYDLSNPQSFNRYAYVQNDPVNFMDPLGLDPNGVLGGLLGVVAGMGPGTSIVTVAIGSDPGNVLGGDAGAQLLILLFHQSGRGASQNTFVGNSGEDPCAYLLPANIPPGVRVDEDIRVAEGLYRQATRPIADLGGTGARGSQPVVIFMDFYDRVKTNGIWDYKQIDKEGIRRTGRRCHNAGAKWRSGLFYLL